MVREDEYVVQSLAGAAPGWRVVVLGLGESIATVEIAAWASAIRKYDAFLPSSPKVPVASMDHVIVPVVLLPDRAGELWVAQVAYPDTMLGIAPPGPLDSDRWLREARDLRKRLEKP
jgi:hypothetical protein